MLTRVGEMVNVLLTSWLLCSIQPNAQELGGKFHILMKSLPVALDLSEIGPTHLSGGVSIHI